MTDSWNEKQLAQFARIRDGFMKTGFSRDVAEAHAARTLREREAQPEKPRRTEGETKDELYHEAKRYNIAGRSQMDKSQLAAAVKSHRTQSQAPHGQH